MRKEPVFQTGTIVVTRGVGDLMEKEERFRLFVGISLSRYAEGDFGEICKEDAKTNAEALKNGDRLMGVYKCPGLSEWDIWIITEWDRSVTTILFPEEY